jgi:pentatricopeptide repeat protein
MAKATKQTWTIESVYALRDGLIAQGECPMTPVKCETMVNVLTFLLCRIHELEDAAEVVEEMHEQDIRQIEESCGSDA